MATKGADVRWFVDTNVLIYATDERYLLQRSLRGAENRQTSASSSASAAKSSASTYRGDQIPLLGECYSWSLISIIL